MYFAEHDCADGSVRLVGGLVDSEGTVEICQNGSWNSLCPSGWGYQEAFVVCRQLGLPATGELFLLSTTHMYKHMLLYVTSTDPCSNSVVHKCKVW